MKKNILIFMLVIMLVLLCACSGKPAAVSGSPTPTGSGLSPDLPQPSGSAVQPSGSAPASASASASSKLYDPSIFVIEASGKWTMELMKGYNADCECEIYLNKIDPNDNRAVEGVYQGVFWMNVKVDATDYIKKLLKDTKVKVDFAVGGEAVCDNFGISLNTTDDKAWVDYKIPGKDGKALPLTQDTPVAKGSFAAVTKDVYLKAKASGAQGEKLDYSKFPKDAETDVNYIVHVEPDSAESGGVRKIVFYFTDSNGVTVTLNGTMKRLPGYPEDVTNYLNSKEYEDAAKKHLQE